MAVSDITLLIVDDDPVVTATLRAQVNRIPGFRVVAIAHTGREGLAAARRFAPHLILLDLHLPDMPGLDMAHQLHQPGRPSPDIIVISSRRDSAAVRAAMQRGALHYLVKPTRTGTVEQTLNRYATALARLSWGDRAVEQQEIDRIFRSLHLDPVNRPKKVTAPTEQSILDALAAAESDLSAQETAEAVGISRATARRYLEYLTEQGQVEENLRYGATGRPQHRYRLWAP